MTALVIALPCLALVVVTFRVCQMLERRAVSREELDQRWHQHEVAMDHIEGRMDEVERQGPPILDRLHRVEQKIERSKALGGSR